MNYFHHTCLQNVSSPVRLQAHGDNPGKTTRVAVAVVDTFVWQALASVIIPGFTINRVCAASLHLLGKTTRWPLPVRKWTTTAIGLSTIPFIITPIDRSDFVWLHSLRGARRAALLRCGGSHDCEFQLLSLCS